MSNGAITATVITIAIIAIVAIAGACREWGTIGVLVIFPLWGWLAIWLYLESQRKHAQVEKALELFAEQNEILKNKGKK